MRNFPPNCPPDHAVAHVGSIYRFAKTIEAKEFESHFVRYPAKQWGDKLCEALGLSVCVSMDDAIAMQKLVPGMSKKNIAVATLDGSAGDVARTSSTAGHYTWWPSDGFDIVTAFSFGGAA